MTDPKQLLQRVINRLQIDIDGGYRIDEGSKKAMMKALRTVLAQLDEPVAEPVRTRAVPLRRVHAHFQTVRNAATAARLPRRTVPALQPVDVQNGQAGAGGGW